MNNNSGVTSETQFPPNCRVRLKGDPTRIGIATGKTKPARRVGGVVRVQVTFPDATSWIPGDQLECMPSSPESPIDLLQSGKLGKAVDYRRTLMHMRLTGRLADVIYSMEATNTDFYPYQFKPVLRFLMSPTNAMLIADEVGLGKTIEAGLIWTELKSRFDYRRLLVFCPAVLREKWQRELAGKMGVDAEIVDAKLLLKRLREPTSKLNGFALICSLQGARPQRDWQHTDTPTAPAELARLFREKEQEDPLVDLLIIDEAHYLRNPDSQTNELGQLARQISENLLLLSATPIHNYSQDLFSLLQLLDPDTFERLEDLSLILDASRPLVDARDAILRRAPSRIEAAELIDRASSHRLLQGNQQLALVRETLSDESALDDRDSRARLARQLETVNPLAYVITRTRKRDVKEWRVIREPVPEKVSMNSHEAESYRAVTDLVVKYAMSQDTNMRFLLATPQRQMSSSMAATLRAWQQRSDNFSDESALDNSGEEIGPLTLELISRANEFGDVEQLAANDSKYNRVVEHLREYFVAFPNEKVVLFSTFRATLNYLGDRLTKDGIPNIVMHGGVKEPKDTLLRRFEAEPEVRVLLSSEVGSEGVDLQFCRLLINYDLPWNPMRVEQRIGRLDRLGQQADKILIWNLFFDDTIDSRIYERLYEKLNLCREALGDFESVLGDEVRKLTTDLLSGELSPADQEQRIDQTAQALANLKDENENLESEASHLVAYGDYILNEVRAAHEMNRWITGDDLEAYVIDFFSLHYTGCSFRLNEKKGLYEVRLSNEAKQELSEFSKAQRLPATRLTQNSERPVDCRFENRMADSNRGAIETITQFHPVVRFVSKSIEDKESQLRPAVSLRLPREMAHESVVSGDYVLCVSRWSIEGLQAIEKLAFAAAKLTDSVVFLDETQSELLSSDCTKHATDWFEAKNTMDLERLVAIADDQLFGQLEERFEEYVDEVRRKNEDRADLQLRTLERHLENQERKLQRVRAAHVANERESLVKATDGRIAALRNRIERKRLEVDSRREIRFRNDEVLVVVIRVD